MGKRRGLITGIAVGVLAFAAIPPLAHAASGPGAMQLTLGGVGYVHRWSKAGQNEFTPAGQSDLNRWQTMLTLNVHDEVRSGEQLAELANRVLSRYREAGRIIRTFSRPRTAARPAEHLIVAILGAPGVTEAAFARLLLVDGKGVVIVHSRRAHGATAAATIGAWLQGNGPATEQELMGWTAIPEITSLQQLPQNR